MLHNYKQHGLMHSDKFGYNRKRGQFIYNGRLLFASRLVDSCDYVVTKQCNATISLIIQDITGPYSKAS